MTKEEYDLHQEWLKDCNKGNRYECHGIFRFDFKLETGFRADLRYAYLRHADLSSANLRSADLRYAYLRHANLRSADLRYAYLRHADLSSADLRYADLRYADLRYADLSSANLRSADLRYADLRSADLDYSSGLTFSCRSTMFKADMRLAAQLAWHFRKIDFGDCEKAKQAQEFLKELAGEFHLVKSGEVNNE